MTRPHAPVTSRHRPPTRNPRVRSHAARPRSPRRFLLVPPSRAESNPPTGNGAATIFAGRPPEVSPAVDESHGYALMAPTRRGDIAAPLPPPPVQEPALTAEDLGPWEGNGLLLRLDGTADGRLRVRATSPVGRVEAVSSVPTVPDLRAMTDDETERESWRIARRVGLQLFAAAFPPPVERLLEELRHHAGDAPIPIALQIGDPALAALPWELLRDPETDRFLALSERTPFSRFQPGAATGGARSPAAGHLRVRVVADVVDEATMAEAENVGADPNVDVSAAPSGSPAPKAAPHVVQLNAGAPPDRAAVAQAPVLVVNGVLPTADSTPGPSALVAVPGDMSQAARATFLAALYVALAAAEPIDRATALARRAVSKAHGVSPLGWARPVLVTRRPPSPIVTPLGGGTVGRVTDKVKEHTFGFALDCLSGTASSFLMFYIGLILYRIGVSSSGQFDFEAASPYAIYQSFKGLIVELSTYQEYFLLGAAGLLASLTVFIAYLWLRDRQIAPEEQLGWAARLRGPLSSLRTVSFLAVATLTVLGAYAYQQYLWRVLLPIPPDDLGIAITREAAAASFSGQLADALFTQGQSQQIVVRELPVNFDASDTGKARALGKRIGARAVLIYRADQHGNNGKTRYIAYVVFTDPSVGLTVGGQPAKTTTGLQAGSANQATMVQVKDGVDVPALQTDTVTGLVDAAAGIVAFDDGRYRDAINHLQQALPTDPNAPNTGIVNFYLGRSYDLDGQSGPAAAAYERVAAFYERRQKAGESLGPRDELVLAKADYQRGLLAALDSQWVQANAWYQKAVALRADLLARASGLDRPAEVHVTYSLVYTGLADIARATGKPEDETFWAGQTEDEVTAIAATAGVNDARAYVEQSSSLFFIGDCVGASAALDKALVLDPANVEALSNAAIIAYSQGNVPIALDRVNEIIRSRPNDVGARNLYAMLLSMQGMGGTSGSYVEPTYLAQAATTYQEILKLDPTNVGAHDGLADLAYLRGSWAVMDLTAVMSGDQVSQAKSQATWPDDPARRQQALDAYADEIEQRRVIASTLRPGNPSDEVALAQAYVHRQLLVYTTLLYLKAHGADIQSAGAQVVSDNAQILDWTGKVLAQTSGATRLERLQAWHLRINSLSNAWGWYAFYVQDKAQAQSLQTEYVQQSKAALAYVEQAAPTTPDEASAMAQIYLNYSVVAVIEHDDKAAQDAKDKFQTLFTQSFNNQAASIQHLTTYCREVREQAAGEAALAQGDLKGARGDFEAAIKANPKHAPSLNDLSWVLYQQGDVKGAIAQATAGTRAGSALPPLWSNLGLYQLVAGDASARDAAYTQFLTIVGKLPPQERMSYLGAALKDLRDLLDKQPGKAPRIIAVLPTFQHGLDSMVADGKGTYQYPALYTALGGIALYADDPATAETLLRRAIALDPHQAVARTDLALAVIAQGHDPAPEIAAAIKDAQDPIWSGIGNGETDQLTAIATEVLRYTQRFSQRSDRAQQITAAVTAERTRLQQSQQQAATPAAPEPPATPASSPAAAPAAANPAGTPAAAATPIGTPSAKGGTYRSPTYGYTLHWDAPWQVNQQASDQSGDILVLVNGTSIVQFLARGTTDTSPAACLRDGINQDRSDPAISQFALAKGKDGKPISGGNATRGYAAFTFTISRQDGTPLAVTEYRECRVLVPGTAVLDISQITPADQYDQQRPLVAALLDEIALPKS